MFFIFIYLIWRLPCVNRSKGGITLSERITVGVDFDINYETLDQTKNKLVEIKNEAQQIPAIGETMTQGIDNAL